MTDFRDLHNRPHDLRSQLGLKNSGMTDERRISLGLPPLNEQNQESLRAEIADALRFEPKPLDPTLATPEPLRRAIAGMDVDDVCRMSTPELLHRIMSVTGCTSQAQARRIHKWFEVQDKIVNITVSENSYQDLDSSEILANIRKMIDSPEVQHLRALGRLNSTPRAIDVLNAAEHFHGEPMDPVTLQPYPKKSIQLEETSMTDMSSQLLFDARRLAELIPPGVILIKGLDPAEYVAQFSPHSGVLDVTYDDIKSMGVLTVAQASVLRGVGLHAVPGYFLGGPVNTTEPGNPIPRATNAPAPRTLTDILAHVKNLESDILEALIMANQNPETDRRRTAAARDQLEMGFMMLKKAVDPQ